MLTRSGERAVDVRKEMRGGAGEVRVESLMPVLPEKARLFATLRLAPGCSIGYHVHENETELFYFVSGHGRASDNGQIVDVGPGDAMRTGPGMGHSVECVGDEELVLVAAIVKE